jgi:hypothetical protein
MHRRSLNMYGENFKSNFEKGHVPPLVITYRNTSVHTPADLCFLLPRRRGQVQQTFFLSCLAILASNYKQIRRLMMRISMDFTYFHSILMRNKSSAIPFHSKFTSSSSA